MTFRLPLAAAGVLEVVRVTNGALLVVEYPHHRDPSVAVAFTQNELAQLHNRIGLLLGKGKPEKGQTWQHKDSRERVTVLGHLDRNGYTHRTWEILWLGSKRSELVSEDRFLAFYEYVGE